MRWANQDEAARAAAARLREARDTAVSSAFAAVGPGGGETFGHAWRDAVVDLEHVEQLRQYARYAPVDRRHFSALGARAASALVGAPEVSLEAATTCLHLDAAEGLAVSADSMVVPLRKNIVAYSAQASWPETTLSRS